MARVFPLSPSLNQKITVGSKEFEWDGNFWKRVRVTESDITSSVSSATTDANSYTDNAIASLVNTAPATLDTLNELAAALGDDPNFATTVTNQIAGKASASHTHEISEITGLQNDLDKKFVANAIFKAYGIDNNNTNDSATFTTRPVIGSPTINVGTFTSTSDTITVPRAGIYECSFSFYWESGIPRTNVGVCWEINGTTQNEVSASDYIRVSADHNEATTSMTTIYDLSANDELRLRFAGLATVGNVNLIGSKSVITVKRVG